LLDGAAQPTMTVASPAVTEEIVGVMGTSAGVTGFESVFAPRPKPLLATTENEYVSPLVSPEIVQVVVVVVKHMRPVVLSAGFERSEAVTR